MKNEKLEDTYCECFNMWFSRILITAHDEELALTAAKSTVGFATSIIMCSAEAGIEQTIDKSQTPDGRPGVIIQIWTRKSKNMKDELLKRLSQCAMTAPTTSIFNWLSSGEKNEPIGKLISFFGDGFQKEVELYGRKMWEIPVMDGSFLIENSFTFTKGVAGGLILLIGKSLEGTISAAKTAIKAIQLNHILGITSFPGGICRSGSKIGSKYSFLNESTNHQFCPTIRDKISDSKIPKNAKCVYEIIINAINELELQKAMKEAILAVIKNDQIIKITTSNFDGNLGNVKINLKDL